MTSTAFDILDVEEVLINDFYVTNCSILKLDFSDVTLPTSFTVGDDLTVTGKIFVQESISQNPLIVGNKLSDCVFTDLEVENINVLKSQSVNSSTIVNLTVNGSMNINNLNTNEAQVFNLKVENGEFEDIDSQFGNFGTVAVDILNVQNLTANSCKSNYIEVDGDVTFYDVTNFRNGFETVGTHIVQTFTNQNSINLLTNSTMDDVSIQENTSVVGSCSASSTALSTSCSVKNNITCNSMTLNSFSSPSLQLNSMQCSFIPSSVTTNSITTSSITSPLLRTTGVTLSNNPLTFMNQSIITQNGSITSNKLQNTQVNGSLNTQNTVYVNDVSYGYQFSDGSIQYSAQTTTPALGGVLFSQSTQTSLVKFLAVNPIITTNALVTMNVFLQPSKKYYIEGCAVVAPSSPDVSSTMVASVNGRSIYVSKMGTKNQTICVSNAYTVPPSGDFPAFKIEGLEGSDNLYSTVTHRYLIVYEVS